MIAWENRSRSLMRHAGMSLLLVGIVAFAFMRRDSTRESQDPAVDVTLRSATDTLLVLFLSGSCGACRQEPAASRLKAVIKAYSARSPQRHRIVGVALDLNASQARRYLDSVGNFDEISAGAGWTNHLSLQYLFADSIPTPAVPQLLVIERATVVGRSASSRAVSVEDRVVQRHVGLHAINHWFDQAMGRAQ